MKKFNQIKIRETLRSSYWFVPTLMTVGAIALATLTLTIDKAGKSGLIGKFGWAYGGADAALTLLSTIANSMITVADTA